MQLFVLLDQAVINFMVLCDCGGHFLLLLVDIWEDKDMMLKIAQTHMNLAEFMKNGFRIEKCLILKYSWNGLKLGPK